VDFSPPTHAYIKTGGKMESIKLGMQAPEFTLEDSNGESVSLADLRGKKVIFYFFTSPGGGN